MQMDLDSWDEAFNRPHDTAAQPLPAQGEAVAEGTTSTKKAKPGQWRLSEKSVVANVECSHLGSAAQGSRQASAAACSSRAGSPDCRITGCATRDGFRMEELVAECWKEKVDKIGPGRDPNCGMATSSKWRMGPTATSAGESTTPGCSRAHQAKHGTAAWSAAPPPQLPGQAPNRNPKKEIRPIRQAEVEQISIFFVLEHHHIKQQVLLVFSDASTPMTPMQ